MDVEVEADDDGSGYASVLGFDGGVGRVADFIFAEEALNVGAEGTESSARLIGDAGADEVAVELALISLDAQVDTGAESIPVPLRVDPRRTDDGSGVGRRSLLDCAAKHAVAADLYWRVFRVGWRIVRSGIRSWVAEGRIEDGWVELGVGSSCGKRGQKEQDAARSSSHAAESARPRAGLSPWL